MTARTRAETRERRVTRALLAAWWSNLAIWAALLALLFASLGFAYLPLGAWNFPVGLIIAALKSALVGYFFMSLRRGSPLILLCVAAGVLFVVAMYALTYNDLFTRS
jgi:cytochrome c oxidase subunit 4